MQEPSLHPPPNDFAAENFERKILWTHPKIVKYEQTSQLLIIPITNPNQGESGVKKNPVPWYFYWDCLIIAKLIHSSSLTGLS